MPFSSHSISTVNRLHENQMDLFFSAIVEAVPQKHLFAGHA